MERGPLCQAAWSVLVSGFKHLHLLDQEVEAKIAVWSSQTLPTVVLLWFTQPSRGAHSCWAFLPEILCDQSCYWEILLCSCQLAIHSLARMNYLSRPLCLLWVFQNQTSTLRWVVSDWPTLLKCLLLESWRKLNALSRLKVYLRSSGHHQIAQGRIGSQNVYFHRIIF